MFYMNRDYKGTQRYSLGRFTRWASDMYDSMDSVWIRDMRILPAAGQLTVKTQSYRPDLLGQDIYGDVDMWTIPMLYNNLLSEEEIQPGLEITYPSLADLETLYFRLIGASGAAF